MLSPPLFITNKRVDWCTRGQSPVYSSTVAKSSIIIRKFVQHQGWPGLFCGARRRVEIDTDVDFRGYHPTWTWPSSSSSYALAFAYASSSTQLSFQSFICKIIRYNYYYNFTRLVKLVKSRRIFAKLYFQRCLGVRGRIYMYVKFKTFSTQLSFQRFISVKQKFIISLVTILQEHEILGKSRGIVVKLNSK